MDRRTETSHGISSRGEIDLWHFTSTDSIWQANPTELGHLHRIPDSCTHDREIEFPGGFFCLLLWHKRKNTRYIHHIRFCPKSVWLEEILTEPREDVKMSKTLKRVSSSSSLSFHELRSDPKQRPQTYSAANEALRKQQIIIYKSLGSKWGRKGKPARSMNFSC